MKFSDFCDSDIRIDNQNIKKSTINNFENNNKNTINFNKNSENMQKNSQDKQNFQNFDIDQNLKNKMNTYQNMTEQELQTELFKEVSRQKQNGTFSLQRIEEVKDKLLPMLTEEQRQKLEGLIKMLR